MHKKLQKVIDSHREIPSKAMRYDRCVVIDKNEEVTNIQTMFLLCFPAKCNSDRGTEQRSEKIEIYLKQYGCSIYALQIKSVDAE